MTSYPFTLTALAMLAFAANSVLCRMALGEDAIDAASFTAIRLISGAIMLAVILVYKYRGSTVVKKQINIVSALALFTYAICFSFSYVQLTTGTGALILFGTVQITMILFALVKGERHELLVWLGMMVAFSGLVYLLLPGVSKPPLISAMLMTLSGIAWGVYSIRGKYSNDPVISTAWNFIATIPLALVVPVLFYAEISITIEGLLLAIMSGAIASALGYVIWYSVLPRITPTNAATVQLSVPVIAAFGGLLLVGEAISMRLVVAGLLVLGGIYMTIRASSSKH